MSPNIQKIFDEAGVDKVAFYYGGASLLNNAYTTCLFINSSKQRIEARGVSICSVRDTYCRKSGKSRSFGRAVKALHRKENDGKINPDGRYEELVRREFKCKNQEAADSFNAMVDEAFQVDPTIYVSLLPGNDIFPTKYAVDIPLSYPIAIANQNYKYKSQYRPNPAGKEEALLLKPKSPSVSLADPA